MIPKSKQAFSLVEVLVTIAVVAIVTVIAIPALSHVNETARDSSAKRNAQEIASISAAANAAGAYHVIPPFVPNGGIQGSIDLLSVGVLAQQSDILFQYSISETAAKEAEKYLEIRYTGSEFVLAYQANIN